MYLNAGLTMYLDTGVTMCLDAGLTMCLDTGVTMDLDNGVTMCLDNAYDRREKETFYLISRYLCGNVYGNLRHPHTQSGTLRQTS